MLTMCACTWCVQIRATKNQCQLSKGASSHCVWMDRCLKCLMRRTAALLPSRCCMEEAAGGTVATAGLTRRCRWPAEACYMYTHTFALVKGQLLVIVQLMSPTDVSPYEAIKPVFHLPNTCIKQKHFLYTDSAHQSPFYHNSSCCTTGCIRSRSNKSSKLNFRYVECQNDTFFYLIWSLWQDPLVRFREGSWFELK